MSIKFACQIKVPITHVYSYPFFNFLLQAFTSLRAHTTTTQTSVHRVDFQQKKKSVLEKLDTIREIDEEERSIVRQRISRDTGYTGLSILHRLLSPLWFPLR